MMFAIFEDGSHQYQVQVGDRLAVDYRESAAAGEAITFDRVLLANDGENSSIGRPTIDGASVETEILDQIKGKKLEIVKFRRRKNSRTHTGHRQKYTEVRVTSIAVPGMEFTAPEKEGAVTETAVEEAVVEEAVVEEAAVEEAAAAVETPVEEEPTAEVEE